MAAKYACDEGLKDFIVVLLLVGHRFVTMDRGSMAMHAVKVAMSLEIWHTLTHLLSIVHLFRQSAIAFFLCHNETGRNPPALA